MQFYNEQKNVHYFIDNGVKDMKATFITKEEWSKRDWKLDYNKMMYESSVLEDLEKGGSSSWAYGRRAKDKKEYVKNVQTGISSDTKLIKKLQEMIQSIDFSHNSKAQKRRKRRSEFDGEFNFERGMAGEADIFDMKQPIDNDRAIDFVVQINCLAMFSQANYERRILEFFARVCKAMELGYMVRISTYGLNNGLFTDNKHRRRTACFFNTVKDYGEPIDLHLIANLCCIGFFRGFGFANEIINADEIEAEVASGLGRTENRIERIKETFADLGVTKGYFYQVVTDEEHDLTTNKKQQYNIGTDSDKDED